MSHVINLGFRVTALLAAVVLTAGSGAAQWEKLNGPKGASIADLAIDPGNPQVVYMAVDGGGIFKSTNGGFSWSPRNSGLGLLDAWTIEVSPLDSEVVYAGIWHGGFYRSQNGGLTWQANTDATLGSKIWSISLSHTNAGLIYVSNDKGVYKSTDAGVTWQSKKSGLLNPVISKVAIDPSSDNILMACNWMSSPFHVYTSSDGGNSWFLNSNGLDSTAGINSVAFDPNNSTKVYAATDAGVYKGTRGTDLGITWSQSNSGLTNTFVREIVVDPANSAILYASTWRGLFKSTNSGTAWSRIDKSFSHEATKPIQFGSSSSRLLVGGFGKLHLSTDGGTSWTSTDSGLVLDAIVSWRSVSIDPDNTQRLIVGTYGGGAWLSLNGGSSWTPFGPMETAGAPGVINGDGGIKRYPPWFPWPLPTPEPTWMSVDGGGVYKSTDDGLTWVQKSAGLANMTINRLVTGSVSEDTLYVATRRGVFKSTNGANSWTPIASALSGEFIRDIAIDPTNPNVLYIATDSLGVFKSFNGGITINPKNAGLTSLRVRTIAISPSDPSKIFAATNLGVVKSINGADSWSPAGSQLADKRVSNLVIDPTDPTVVLAGTYGQGIFRSVDGGTSWSNYSEGLGDGFANALVFDPLDEGTVYVGTNQGVYVRTGMCRIAKTGDVNIDGVITSADIISLVNFVFKGGLAPKPCMAAGDANCSGAVTSADIIYMVNHVFKGSAAPCDGCTSPLAAGC
jgi:photosystem II stability/assembly factor-like uncharacterized protein